MNGSEEYSHKSLSDTFYCSQSFPSAEATKLFEYQLEGCKCSGNCIESMCPCIQRSGTNYIFENIYDTECYRLTERFQDVPSYECNDNCNCFGQICGNKLIQYGPRKNLLVKKCECDLKGLGLFTNIEIKKGNFICEYAGEIITQDEASNRYRYYKRNNEVNYIFCIKEQIGDKILKTFIDPTRYGNLGRYINHSCEPNSKPIAIRTTEMIPFLAIFANQNIAINSEITYDYGCDNTDYLGSAVSRKNCFCMTKTCKQYLPCDFSSFL